jgi:methylenetetrahydrofolate reductase (NADPH)
VNPVTWGTFPGKEYVGHSLTPFILPFPANLRLLTPTRIITPTIIEAVSFRAWIEEAFSIWKEWQHIYPHRSATAKLLGEIREGYWLVNVIHHGYVEKDALWKLLLE